MVLIWNSAHWFQAALFNRNPMVPGRSNRPRMVCSDIRAYILLIHAEIGRQRVDRDVISYVLEKGTKQQKERSIEFLLQLEGHKGHLP